MLGPVSYFFLIVIYNQNLIWFFMPMGLNVKLVEFVAQ